MKQKTVWKLILKSLSQGIPVMLLYVLESKGSSPGRQGFSMAVNSGGEMAGSIGGGIMEHKFVELAKERLKESGSAAEVKKQFHDKTASGNQSGMICSGEQTVLLYRVSESEKPYIVSLLHSLEKNLNGTLKIFPGGIEFHENEHINGFFYEYNSNESWIYKEQTGYQNKLFIIGGGHCSLALSQLMNMNNFYIDLYEDRERLNTFDDNGFVHEKHKVESYTALGDLIAAGQNHYVVIMTFGYRTDDLAVKALMNKEFAYLGLLGSNAKIKKMFDVYRTEGISEEVLQRIKAPAGIAIKSRTPEEIAVSIAAEIISIKNTRK